MKCGGGGEFSKRVLNDVFVFIGRWYQFSFPFTSFHRVVLTCAHLRSCTLTCAHVRSAKIAKGNSK